MTSRCRRIESRSRRGLWRWVKRRKTLVAAGVALLLTATVSLFIATLLLRQEKGRTEEALQKVHARRRKRPGTSRSWRRPTSPKYRAAANQFFLTQIAEDFDSFDGLKGPQLNKKILEDSLLFYRIFTEDTQSRPGRTDREGAVPIVWRE